MINTNRIVPVTRTDLLTLIAMVMVLAGTTVTKASAENPGIFDLASGSGNLLADEPVKKFNFGESVSSATVYFIPGLDYEGFSIAGVAAEPSGDEVSADGCTLYAAALSGGVITITKKGF